MKDSRTTTPYKLLEKYIDPFESSFRSHDDNMTEFFGTDDLLIKGKFNFLDKKLKLSGKTKLNQVKNAATNTNDFAVASDYSIDHKLPNGSSYKFSHKEAGETSVEGTFTLAEQDNYGVYLHTNNKIFLPLPKRSINSYLQVRVHHSNNKVFSFGFEDYNPLQTNLPNKLSLYNLYGCQQRDFNAIGGFYAAYDLKESFVPSFKFLAGLKHRQVNAYLQTAVDRKKVEAIIDPKLNVTGTKIVNEPEVKLTVDTHPRSDLKVFGDVKYNVNAERLDLGLGTEYLVEPGTRVKAKVANDRSLFLAMVHNYRNTVNFAMTAKFLLDKPKTETDLTNIKYKFGVQVEFSD